MEKKLRYIDGKYVSHCIGFVYDGCHKIYVCENQAQFDKMKQFGYEELCPMSALEKTFDSSCPLRFIDWADLHSPEIVPQCANVVTFTYADGKESVLEFDY